MTRQVRAARTRRALIRSAAEVFDQSGYAQARLTDISAGAGVSPGALHFHFENKAAVAEAVESAAGDALLRAARVASRLSPNPLQALIDISHVLALLLREDVVIRAGFHLNGDSTRRGDLSFCRRWQGCIQKLLAAADADGLLTDGVVQSATTCTIVAATTGIGVLSRDNTEWLARRALTGLWRALLPGLAAPSVLDRLNPTGTDAAIDRAAAARLAEVRAVEPQDADIEGDACADLDVDVEGAGCLVAGRRSRAR